MRWQASGARLRDAGIARHVYVISDEQVAPPCATKSRRRCGSAEIPFDLFAVPPGEASKTLETASRVYDWLIDHRAERGHTVVAVGGGVVTDLGGFVAATFARGLPLVHVPTSLLGMVDASIGGKVAVNHPKAKNMIGAFYQPRIVLADAATLRTLPPRDVRQGWAEAIKHAMIADVDYLRFFEDNADAILKLERDVDRRGDPPQRRHQGPHRQRGRAREKGIRSFLNYGHTLAHAIESTTGYTRFRHGEADGIGMMAAARMSVMMGLAQQRRGRPPARACWSDTACPPAPMGSTAPGSLLPSRWTRRSSGKTVRWVLLEGIGQPVLRDDVPADVVERALNEVLR